MLLNFKFLKNIEKFLSLSIGTWNIGNSTK